MENTLPPWWPKKPAIYDIEKSYLENAEEGPFFDGPIPSREKPDRSEWIDFLGYPVASRIGIPAGPLLNSNWIALASKLGFDVLTYKTIRNYEHPAHPMPNIVPVETNGSLLPGSLPGHLMVSKEVPKNSLEIGITNSFGNPSRSAEYLMEDIPRANKMLEEGQVMIVSVFEDFANSAKFAVDCGAKIIEANFSCPNVKKEDGMLYANPDTVFRICREIVFAIGDIPLIIKVGLFADPKILKESMVSAARAGVRAICGINTISMPVLNAEKKPALGPGRETCGICGTPIREAALRWMREAAAINREERLDLTLMGTGGAMIPEHFDQFLKAGADIAMTATGMMWDPLLAMRYHKERNAAHSGII